jgi:hypothetical protein
MHNWKTIQVHAEYGQEVYCEISGSHGGDYEDGSGFSHHLGATNTSGKSVNFYQTTLEQQPRR